MPKWPHQSDADAFYGNPRGKNGEVNPQWESAHIVHIKPPWKLVTAWDFMPVNRIRIHKNCSESLQRILLKIWKSSGEDQLKINEWGMNLYAGGFSFRLMRGSSRLSMHSWGCAIDFDPARNAFGDHTPNFASIPAVIEAFSSEKWTWGGNWRKPDGMHWQAANI